MTSASSTKMLCLLLTLFSLALFTRAKQHRILVGTYGTPSIYSLKYDDTAGTLTATQNNTTRTENEWLALSYDSKTLYSSGRTGWSSFPVTSTGEIGKEISSTPAVGQCSLWEGAFVLASRRAPYTVYGSLSCANYIGVNADGSIGKATAIPYNEAVVIYGMAMDPSNNYLYSNDWRNGKIWAHKVNADGTLTVLGSVEAPSAVSAPRSIAVHPSGRALYVILETWNAVALYTIDATSHLPVYTKALYPLVPADANAGGYGAQTVVVSTKGTVLWATSRSKTTGSSGYITGFELSETGMIQQTLFQVPTPTSGGRSNNVVACPFSENVIALTEAEQGSVSIWKYVNGTAHSVASVSIKDSTAPNKGCCSDAVWVD